MIQAALPVEIHTTPASLLWALPLCLAISMVYKAVKLETFTPAVVIKEVTLLFVTIIGFLILVALILLTIAHVSTIW